MADQTDAANAAATGNSGNVGTAGSESSAKASGAANEASKASAANAAASDQAASTKAPASDPAKAPLAPATGTAPAKTAGSTDGEAKVDTSGSNPADTAFAGMIDETERNVNRPDLPEAIARQHDAVDKQRAALDAHNEEGHQKNMEAIEKAAEQAQDAKGYVPTGKETNNNTPIVHPDGSKTWR